MTAPAQHIELRATRLSAEALAAARRVAEKAPPLTEEQRARLRALLTGRPLRGQAEAGRG
ncbi:MAG: hypothetical protein JWO98_168 [Frankiales bacterium]|nr:hypothetical protein [Frankiales bacterium]